MISRRRFAAAVALGLLASPLSSRAKTDGQVRRVGFVTATSRTAPPLSTLQAIEIGLREHGYEPGKNVIIEVVFTSSNREDLSTAIRELVAKKVDVILALTNPVVEAARSVAPDIPVVMIGGTDVVRSGFVRSLAKPGGNVTGLTWDVGVVFITKRLQLLKELAPHITRVGVLWEPPYEEQFRAPTDEAAAKLGLGASWIRMSANVQRDFGAMAQEHCDALFPHLGLGLPVARAALVSLARARRWPSAFADSVSVEAGGLMSYAPNGLVQTRSTVRFVDRILRGARPADLPVEQPTVLEFVINLRTAEALGLSIQQSLLQRADRVIE